MSSWLSFVLVVLLMGSSAYGVRQLVRPRSPAPARDPGGPRPPTPRYWWLQSRWAGAAWLALGLLGLTTASNSVGWQTEGTAFWSDGGVPALDARLRGEIVGWGREHRPVGVAVGIVADDGVARATFGRSRLTPGGPPLREALFEIGSINKTFTGILLARMVGDGLVRLDQRMSDSLPPGIDLPVGLELAQRERFRIGPDRARGLAWARSRREDIGQTVVWHNGRTGGFKSFLGFTADGRFGVVVLANTPSPIDAFALRLLATVVDGGV